MRNIRAGYWGWAAYGWGLSAVVILLGCSGGEFSTAKVTGKVTYQGKPIDGGTLNFTPKAGKNGMSGKPGNAAVQKDGSYSVTTYVENDGAVIGPHSVAFIPPPVGDDKPHFSGDPPPPESPYKGLVLKPSEVEVKKGSNSLDFELVSPSEAASNPAGK